MAWTRRWAAFGQLPGSVSPDGATLAYVDDDPTNGSDLWLLPLQGARQPRLFLSTPLGETNPMFSPDGRWLAYQSNVSGRFEIYVASVMRGGRGMSVSKGGGNAPLWSRDGRELYYRDVDYSQSGKMMAVTIEGNGAEPTRTCRRKCRSRDAVVAARMTAYAGVTSSSTTLSR